MEERVAGCAFIVVGIIEAGNATMAASVNHTLTEAVPLNRPSPLKN